MTWQDIQDGLLVTLVFRYEEDPHQFLTLSRQTLDSSSARMAVAELRNEGLVEEQLRGVIRLTARGYKKYKTKLPYTCASLNRYHCPKGALRGNLVRRESKSVQFPS